MNGFGQSRFFGGGVLGIFERGVVPAIQEVVDLRFVQILQDEMAEFGVGQSLRFVTDDARRDDDADLRVLITEIVNVVDDV